MQVLWLYAHPERRSLNGSLRDEGLEVLRQAGHEVRLSDLYAMRWNPVVEAGDFGHDQDDRLEILPESERAYRSGALSEDIRLEQEKLRWADTVVVQFPLWWFGPPAILKGWFDRVFVQGFAQGVLDPVTGRALRYGSGGLAGKRAMVVATIGANAATVGPRGIHGDVDEVLFPVQHGTLWYSGMTVVPPVLVTGANRLDHSDYVAVAADLRQRVLSLPTAEPIPFRRQDSGDYDEHLVLRDTVARGETGLSIHHETRVGETQGVASRVDFRRPHV